MIEGVVFDFGGVLVKPQEESFYGMMEARFGWTREANKRCDGPKLLSFSGDSSKLTPRARWY